MSSENNKTCSRAAEISEDIRLYKKRWILMVIFIWYTIWCGVHWVQFSSLSETISKFYNVSSNSVQWTTITYPVVNACLIFPVLFLQHKIGTRNSMILSSLILCTGATLKIFSTNSDKFILVMVSQVFVAVPTVFTYCLIGRFTASWFGNKEISRANALTLVGDQMGGALSFLLPSYFIVSTPDQPMFKTNLLTMHLVYAFTAYLTLFLIVFFFKEQPKLPPSNAEAVKLNQTTETVGKSIMKALSNPKFIVISMIYGFIVSACQAFSTFLDTFVMVNFRDKGSVTGELGFVLMLSGMIGSLIVSYILDKTRKFKENVIILSAGSCFSVLLIIVSLKLKSFLCLYVSVILLGFFTMSMYATGIQMGVEATYPLSEEIVSATMLLCTQSISMVSNFLFGPALKLYGDIPCLFGIAISLCAGTILSCLIPPKLKREKFENTKPAETKSFLPNHSLPSN